MPRTAALFFLKILVTCISLWWLSGYFELQQIRETLAGVSPALILLAVGLHVSSYLVGGVRWWLLFQHLTGPIHLRYVMPSYYLGVFFNNVLPSAYGGDFARSARLYLSGLSGSALAGSALMDRLLGLLGVVVMGLLALFLSPASSAHAFAWPVFAAGLLGFVGGTALIIFPRWIKKLDSKLGDRWPRLQAVLACFARYRAVPGLIFAAFGLSILNQGFVVLVFLILAPALGIDIPVIQFVIVLMLVFLVSSLPISLGGLGPREGVMMALLLPLGVESSLVIALSIVYLLVLWCSAVPGIFMLFLSSHRLEM